MSDNRVRTRCMAKPDVSPPGYATSRLHRATSLHYYSLRPMTHMHDCPFCWGGDLGPHLMMVFGPSESAMWRNKRERGRGSKKAAGGTSRRECMDGVLSGCSGQLQLVHGAGVRRRRRDVFSPAQNWQVQVSPATRCCGCCSRWVSCASWSLFCPRYGSGVLW